MRKNSFLKNSISFAGLHRCDSASLTHQQFVASRARTCVVFRMTVDKNSYIFKKNYEIKREFAVALQFLDSKAYVPEDMGLLQL